MKLQLSLFFFFLTSTVIAQEQVSDFFSNEIIEADVILRKHKALIRKLCTEANVPSKTVCAIIYPELLRYSKFQDFFETKALELLYINSGSQAVDFSIGHFQMKPSFVELLEKKLAENDYKDKYETILDFPSENLNEKRAIRIDRLQQFNFQLIYAIAFVDLLSTQNKSNISEVQRLACLYNCGIGSSQQQINYWISQCSFPYGTQNLNNPFSYAEVASWYFNNTPNFLHHAL